jgi:hypothetical protein
MRLVARTSHQFPDHSSRSRSIEKSRKLLHPHRINVELAVKEILKHQAIKEARALLSPILMAMAIRISRSGTGGLQATLSCFSAMAMARSATV